MLVCNAGGMFYAICVFSVFALLPGFVIGWFCNLFSFRNRSTLGQTAISIPLSLALVSVLDYLPWRLLSLPAVWVINGVLWTACVGILALKAVRIYARSGIRGFSLTSEWRIGLIAGSVWA